MKARTPKTTTATCSACGKPALMVQHMDKLPNEIEHTYLQCNKCGHKATIAYTDPEIRAKMEAQKAVYRAGDADAIKRNGEAIQAMMAALQRKVEGGHD